MSNTLKNTSIAASLCILFYLSFAYELKGSFLCNIFNPAYYSDSGIIYKLLFSVAVVAVVFLFAKLIKSKYLRKNKFLNSLFNEKAFLLFMLVAGFTASILIPLYQIPDEPAHITMIYEELGLNASFVSFFGLYTQPMDLIHDPDAKVDLITYFNSGIFLSLPEILSSPSIALIKHFPQAVGLLLCSWLKCSLFVTSLVCESLAVIFSSFVCYYALKLMPTRKLVFSAIMALPLCIQQNGSFSYDAVLVPVCFLLFAYILNIKFLKEKFKISDLIIIICLTLIIAIIKIPYVLIAAVVFLIPSDKYAFKLYKWELNGISWDKYKKILIPTIVILMIIGVFGILMITRGSVFVNLLLASIINFPRTLLLIGKFVVLDVCRIWASHIWDFGWLNIQPSVYFLLFIVVSVFIFNFVVSNKSRRIKFSIREGVAIFIIFCICFYLITISMVEHTLFLQGIDVSSLSLQDFIQKYASIDRILGLQGRYYIPILPLLCFSFCSSKLTSLFKNINYKLYSPIYFSIVFIYIVVIMLTRYWI